MFLILQFDSMRFFTILCLLIQLQLMAQSTNKLIYIGDPMCSWCYGIAPELENLVEKMDESIELQLIMGGLRPYNTQTMHDLGDFLSHHWKDVQKRSGQTFNFEILQDKSFIYDTEPPSRAVLVVRELASEREFAFFKAVQTAFYQDNNDTGDIRTYLALAEEFHIDQTAFQKRFEAEDMKQATRDDFAAARELGISSFPSLVFQKGENLYLLCQGYATAEDLLAKIDKILSK